MYNQNFILELGMVVHTCNPSTQEVEAELEIQGQTGLHNETLSKKNYSFLFQ
jgi:hypothetical protein